MLKPLTYLKHHLIGLCLLSTVASASTAGVISETQLRLQDKQSNTLSRAVLLTADAKVNANAIMTEVTLTQTFENRTDHWVEGTYVFPLPENAAVDKMTMQIGDKTIIGKIREKKQAKALYTAAVNNGQKAALVNQNRDNLFTAMAGNIAPHSQIKVTLHYLQPTNYHNGVFSLTLPTTYTPRYIVKNSDPNDEESVSIGSQPLPEQHFTRNHVSRLNLSLSIDAGTTITKVSSRTHQLPSVIDSTGKTASITADNLAMDKDLQLSWRINESDKPLALAFSEHTEQGYFSSVLLIPPQTLDQQQASDNQAINNHTLNNQTSDNLSSNSVAREIIFIIDTSGSMSGDAIRQAKSGALAALHYLRPNDRFNLIAFNDSYRELFSSPQTANEQHISTAKDFIQQLVAGGGTAMYQPLSAALHHNGSDTSPQSDNGDEALRQIVFLTDGAVSNESQLFQLIQQQLGNTRLFTVGIGATPNAYFMKQAATFGRGTHTNIYQISEVSEKIRTLFEQLQYPSLTDISVDLPKQLNAESYPNPIADVYRGYPVVAHIKTDTAPKNGEIVIRGKNTEDNTPWQYALDVTPQSNDHPTLSKLWARQKIDALNHQAIILGNDRAFDNELLDLGLTYQLITKRTAFVAIEESISRDTLNQPLQKKNVPNAIPAGNTMNFPSTSTSSTLTALLGTVLLVLALLLALIARYRNDCSAHVVVDNARY